MLQNIKLIRDHSIKIHNLDKHYDISDETYYNRPFSFRETNRRTGKPTPLWQTKSHYKGTPVPSGRNNGKYKTVMRPHKPQTGEILVEDYIIYHLKANRDW